MATPSSNRGFTLIELAIVLAVLALVAVLAAGRYGNFRQNARITLAQKEMDGIREAFQSEQIFIFHLSSFIIPA